METTDLSPKDYQNIEKMIPSQIPELRTKLLEKYNLVVPDHCSNFLARCLRMKDGNIEKAAKLVKSFNSAIASFQTWDATFRPSEHELFYKTGCVTLLPKRDSKGRMMLLCRVGLWDPEKMNADQFYACVWMFTEYINSQSKDAHQIGLVSVFDDANFTMKHAWAMNKNKWRLLNLAKICQDGVTARCKGYHSVNHPKIISIIYAAVRPFMKKKLKERIIFYESHDALLSHFDKDSLPASAGGTLSNDECIDKDLLKRLLEQDNYFADIIKHGFPSK